MARKQTAAAVEERPVRDETAYARAVQANRLPLEVVEANTVELCRRFGVDESLAAGPRARALAKAIARAGGLGGGYRKAVRERVPGEDDE
jgi:hypothetical protein